MKRKNKKNNIPLITFSVGGQVELTQDQHDHLEIVRRDEQECLLKAKRKYGW